MLSEKNIKNFIAFFTFCKKNAMVLLFLFFITAIQLSADEILDSDIMEATDSTRLNSDSEKLTGQQTPKASTEIHKITTEILHQQNGNVEYYYQEISEPDSTNNTADISPVPVSRKVNIISNSEELPKTPLPKKKRKKKKPQIKTITYVDTVNIKIRTLPDNAPLLSDKIGMKDSIEPFNRAMFKVDNVLFTYVFHPMSKVYSYVVPEYFRNGFKRMDYNIQMPKRLFNNLLQAKWEGAGISFSKFMVDTTVGVVGFYDPSYEWFGWEKYDEDLGQSLGKWGVGPGCYVYIPIIGSSSVRDGLSLIVDDQMDPRAWIPFGGSGIRFVMRFNNFTLDSNGIEQQLEEYYDSYSLKRDFWYMKRTANIAK